MLGIEVKMPKESVDGLNPDIIISDDLNAVEIEESHKRHEKLFKFYNKNIKGKRRLRNESSISR